MTESSPQAEGRTPRRTLIGTVVSTKQEKTITVQISVRRGVRPNKHPKYGKFMRERKRYHAHVPNGGVSLGDRVEIMSSRPISKLKHWRLVRVVASAVERGAEVSELSKI